MSLLSVTFQAVSKVIVAVLVGATCCNWIPNSATTMRDFGFLITNILLPALTVVNTAKSVDVEVLVNCSVLLFFGVFAILIGIGTATLMAHSLFGVGRDKTGIPPEMAGNVRLDLFDEEENHDTAAATESTTNTTTTTTAAAGAGGTAAKKKKRPGVPYVAVILTAKLRDMGVSGHAVVGSLEVPGIEVEEYPFYHWGAWIACSIQNTVTLPLSLLQGLTDSVEWLDFSEGTAYIFVFSIAASLYIWAFGPVYVEWAQRESIKRRLIRQIILRHKAMLSTADALTQTDLSYTLAHEPFSGELRPMDSFRYGRSPVTDIAGSFGRPSNLSSGGGLDYPNSFRGRIGSVGSPAPSLLHPRPVAVTFNTPSINDSMATGGGGGATPQRVDAGLQTDFSGAWGSPQQAPHSSPGIGGCQQLPYDWESSGLIRVRYEDQLSSRSDQPSRLDRFASGAKRVGGRLVRNLPFMSIVVGIVIGVTPPLRALFFDGGVFEMITDALTLIGQGNIPASLLLLGTNLVGATNVSADDEASAAAANRRMRDCEQNTDFPLVVVDDAELLGEAGRYAEWYNMIHQEMEFDEHASFSLHSYLQQQAADRIAAARAEAAAARARALAVQSAAAAAAAALRPVSRLREGRGAAGSGSDDDTVSSGSSIDHPHGRHHRHHRSDDEWVPGSGNAPGNDDDDDVDSANGDGSTAGTNADGNEVVKSIRESGFFLELSRVLSLDGVKKKFVWGVIFERLVFNPFLGFLLVMFLVVAMPFLFGGRGNMNKTLLVVLFMELAAPTAINSNLLFHQRGYMTYQWAKMLFFQYILSTLTLVIWTTIGLEFVYRYAN